MPIVFVKVYINVFSTEGIRGLKLLIPWTFIGPFFLLFYGVFRDMFFFFKVLYDYKVDDEKKAEMKIQDVL